MRSDFSRVDSSGSNSEEFRSVIDDLTLENRSLKRKLRKYEKLHCSQLEDDKLFEVRIHGLPAYKKKELKETLRGFASSIGTQRTSRRVQTEQPTSLSLGCVSGISKTSSVSTLGSRLVDSAYASLCASGQTSASHLRCPRKSQQQQSIPAADENKDVTNSYLEEIPEGLFPNQSIDMTEKVKAKLVVRRLEQLFTGIAPCSTQDYEFFQQQKNSRSAARGKGTVDQVLNQAKSAEGDREARIVSCNDQIVSMPVPVLDSGSDTDMGLNCLNTTSPARPDQRPTRLLDLDPNRVQIPAQNINYIRHLGLTSPKVGSDLSGAEEEGWIYLNLLINMAQLHMFNVTTEFVRRALATFSTRFELAKDGQRVRWTVGRVGNQMSDGSRSSRVLKNEGSSQRSDGSSGRISISSTYGYHTCHSGVISGFEKLDSSPGYTKIASEFGADSVRRPIFLGQFEAGGPLVYKPLFFHGVKSEEEDDYYLNEVRSTVPSILARHSNGPGSHDIKSANEATRKGEDGPIIFYNGARFCTDLSGDSGVDTYHATNYSKVVQDPIGSRPKAAEEPVVCYRKSRSCSPDGFSILEIGECFEDTLEWPAGGPPTLLSPSTYEVESDGVPALFQASGIGGVRPSDHFVVDVIVRFSVLNKPLPPQNPQCLTTKVCQSDICHYATKDLTNHCGHTSPAKTNSDLLPIKYEILSAETRVLNPSSLPPPSYAFHATSSSDGDNEDDEMPDGGGIFGTVSSQPTADVVSAFSTSGRRLSFCASSTSSSIASGEMSEDSSMDLLAHARQLDPDSIAAQEREFEDNAVQMSAFLEAVNARSSARPVAETGYASSQTDSTLLASCSEDEVIRRPDLKRGRSGVDYMDIAEKVPRLDIEEST
ncbi:MAG: hypothetical protein Q9187_003501 [Circinaria calcarea]